LRVGIGYAIVGEFHFILVLRRRWRQGCGGLMGARTLIRVYIHTGVIA